MKREREIDRQTDRQRQTQRNEREDKICRDIWGVKEIMRETDRKIEKGIE